jgi:hypothetical protein
VLAASSREVLGAGPEPGRLAARAREVAATLVP